ncbi:hypothetical protein PZE06_02540 [Robertmurraya sp. DFI.2.37]|nr:hypothetical protein [Robertmurraya sp. DFI.2.37]MDF1507055.1 hypothetical protein [Robertmurraya sp. DFI.2.37]
MRVCEVCGTEEVWNPTEKDSDKIEIGYLHVCEACQQDRKFHLYEPME